MQFIEVKDLRRLGLKYIGSSQMETSVANEEIVTETCYKFSIMVENDCTASINKSEPIFIKAGVGFSNNQVDAAIYSFKILEDGIQYFWVGGN